ncbi:hypothetical protein MD484_g3648, partial [Candolleomyces efflorescens]
MGPRSMSHTTSEFYEEDSFYEGNGSRPTLDHSKSTKLLINQYETMHDDDTTSRPFPPDMRGSSRSTRTAHRRPSPSNALLSSSSAVRHRGLPATTFNATASASFYPSSSHAHSNSNNKKDSSTVPLRHSFKNLLSLLKKGKNGLMGPSEKDKVIFPTAAAMANKKSAALAEEHKQLPLLPIPLGDAQRPALSRSQTQMGALIYLTRYNPAGMDLSDEYSMAGVPLWASCTITLNGKTIGVSWFTPEGIPCARDIELVGCSDIRSVSSDLRALEPEEREALPGGDEAGGDGEPLKVFELLFKDRRSPERFAVASAPDFATRNKTYSSDTYSYEHRTVSTAYSGLPSSQQHSRNGNACGASPFHPLEVRGFSSNNEAHDKDGHQQVDRNIPAFDPACQATHANITCERLLAGIYVIAGPVTHSERSRGQRKRTGEMASPSTFYEKGIWEAGSARTELERAEPGSRRFVGAWAVDSPDKVEPIAVILEGSRWARPRGGQEKERQHEGVGGEEVDRDASRTSPSALVSHPNATSTTDGLPSTASPPSSKAKGWNSDWSSDNLDMQQKRVLDGIASIRSVLGQRDAGSGDGLTIQQATLGLDHRLKGANETLQEVKSTLHVIEKRLEKAQRQGHSTSSEPSPQHEELLHLLKAVKAQLAADIPGLEAKISEMGAQQEKLLASHQRVPASVDLEPIQRQLDNLIELSSSTQAIMKGGAVNKDVRSEVSLPLAIVRHTQHSDRFPVLFL